MYKTIKGVSVGKKKKIVIGHVPSLSDEFKEEVRKRLSTICYGRKLAAKNRGSYTYKQTVKEFLNRYRPKSDATKTGMLGELIFHVVLGIAFPRFSTVIPYFNLEERSIRKGFDSIIFSSKIGLFPCEIKSSTSATSTETDKNTKRLLQKAHSDIATKLGNSGEVARLWINAMNGVQAACNGSKKANEIINEIILDHQEAALKPKKQKEKFDIILSSVLISPASSGATEQAVLAAHDSYNGSFNQLIVVSIHKSSTVGLIKFLEKEAI